MADDKDLQEKMLIYRTLESRLETLAKQREIASNKIVEIASTISGIDEIKNNKGVLFKLGGEAYTHGTVNDKDKILVEIGAGIVLEKSIEDGKGILNKRKEEMETALKEIQSNISQLSGAMAQLGPEINELIQKSQNSTS